MVKKQKAKKANATGRNHDRVGRDEWFIQIRRSLVQSPQYSCLHPTSRSLLLELLTLYNGKNGDSVFLSVRDAADRLGFTDLKPICAAFDELMMVGFIEESVADCRCCPTG